MTGADLIHAQIVKNLQFADVVLCDVSTHNPNVFFELGIRTALNRSRSSAQLPAMRIPRLYSSLP